MMKTRLNGTERPKKDAGLRRGIAAAAVLLIVCVLAVGVVSADTVTVSNFGELESNITNAPSDRTIIVAGNFSIIRQLPIGSGKNITLTTNNTDHTLSRDNFFTDNLFTVDSGGNLTITGNFTQMTNLTLDGMKQSPSDSLVLVNGGSFTLADGGILTNNTASSYGGGVYVGYGTFTMTGGEISCNTGNLGGGVYVHSGTFTMSGGTISENTASSYGGGVYVNSGTFTMSGGTISENTASSYGGGVYVVSSGEFTMLGGTISCNKASGTGGGVFVYNYGTFTMSGGTISKNTAENSAGGVFVVSSGEFTMSGGTISGNTATSGNGDGVYVDSSGTFKLSGSGSTDSVYLTSGKSITVTGELTGTGAQVRGIEFAVLDDGTTVVTGTPLQEDDLSRFELDSSVTGFKLAYQSSNIVLKVQPDCTVQFDAQGGSPKPADVTVPYGGMVTEPTETPVKTGYTFTCWYKEEECINQWDFDTDTVTGDITLYAGWKKDEPQPSPSYSSGDGNMENAFRVLFNDGATTLTVQTDLSYGDKLTKPEDPVKDGYTFAGWHKDTACTQAWDFNDGIPGDMTLYAKWTTKIEATPTATATATAVTTPQPTKTQSTTATTSAPQATTAAGVSPTLTQAPAPVAGALFGLLAAGVLLRRRFQ